MFAKLPTAHELLQSVAPEIPTDHPGPGLPLPPDEVRQRLDETAFSLMAMIPEITARVPFELPREYCDFLPNPDSLSLSQSGWCTAYVSKEWKKGKYGPFPQLKKYKPRSRWLKRHSGVANKNKVIIHALINHKLIIK